MISLQNCGQRGTNSSPAISCKHFLYMGMAWWRSFGDSAELRVLALFDSSRLVGLAPSSMFVRGRREP